jgi:hypothetical protein
VDDGDRFFQYRVRLQSNNPGTSPVLGEFTLVWTNLGTGGGSTPGSFELLPVSPNPSSGSVSVCFCTPEASAVEIAVYDIAGRLALTPVDGEFQPGSHTALMAGLRPGIYFVRMRAGAFDAAERFVVL